MKTYDIVIIGGGAGGLAAAKAAADDDLKVLLLEKDAMLGGILNQCIHNGFGLKRYQEELTGPEYAQKAIDELRDSKVEIKLETSLYHMEKKQDYHITYINQAEGEITIQAKAVIATTGSYERTRGAIGLPGSRPKGVLNAGVAQRYLNIEGFMVGQNVFILGSGDIGLIMARRMHLEGANVLGVAEILPHASGLTRNVVQCLHDFDIPLYLSHTITDIKGTDQLEEITISAVDAQFNPIKGSDKTFAVDALLLSVGLIPDITTFNGLRFLKDERTNGAMVDQHFETSLEGLFIAGNALHIHDLVDWVSDESEQAGLAAKAYVKAGKARKKCLIEVQGDAQVSYILPQRLDINATLKDVTLSYRVKDTYDKAIVHLKQGGQTVLKKKARFLVPAEMERLKLPKDIKLQKNQPLELIVEVIS